MVENTERDEQGLIVLGHDFRVVLWSETIGNISSVPPEQAVGQLIDILFPGLMKFVDVIRQARESAQSYNLSVIPDSYLFTDTPFHGIAERVQIEPINVKGECGTLLVFHLKKNRSHIIDARMILNGLADAVISFDEKGIVESFNEKAVKIFDEKAENAIGRPISRLVPELGLFLTGLGKITLEQRWEVNGIRGGSEVFPIEMALSKVEYEGKILYIVVGTDITDRRKATEQMRRMAHYDALTGLANRLLLEERLTQALAHAKRSGSKVAVLMLDLDHFKEVNDTYGHHAGDELLREIGRRLIGAIRETDTVARLGGDEFVVVLTGMVEAAAAAGIADFILQEISRPVIIDQAEIYPATSIGISIFPDDSIDMEQLIKNADLALYRSKSEGRGTYHFYVSSMDEEVQKRKLMEGDLRRAIEEADDAQLTLYFQPLINLLQGVVSGAEVLVRWKHPKRGFIPPGEFLPAVERTDSIFLLSNWVLERACQTLMRWRKKKDFPQHLRLALNLSQAQFKHPDFFEQVRTTLESYDVPPSLLQFEVTEAIVMSSIATSSQMLGKLRELGISISLDDYGTGYSSLRHLQALPMDKLKIDQSFLVGIETCAEQAAMVQAIVNLGHTLGLSVNVEGVETSGQLALLRNFYVDEVQGYLFSPPIPEHDFLTFVARPSLSALKTS